MLQNKFVLTILFLLLSNQVFCQLNKKHYSFNRSARAIDLIKTKDKGYLITGNLFPTKNRKAAAVLIKLNKYGELEWKKEYSNKNRSYFGWSLIEDKKAFYILGFSDNKAFMIKTTLEGKLIWEKEIGSSQSQKAWSFLKDKNTLVCIGEENISKGKNKVWFFKTDLNGNILSEKRFDSNEKSERAFYIGKLKNNSYLATGTAANQEKIDDDILVSNFNDDGNIIWKKVISIGSKRDVGHALKIHKNQIYIYGYYQTEYGPFNPVVIKLSKKGELIENLIIKHPNRDTRIMNGIKTKNGYTLVGYSKKRGESSFKGIILCINSSGKILNESFFGDSGLNNLYSIKSLGKNKFISAGAITDGYKTKKSKIFFIKSSQ